MPPKKYSTPRVAAVVDATQAKQRKPRAPPAKPPGMSNANWRAEVLRREAVTTDRRNRLNAKRAQDAAAKQAEVSRAGMMCLPGGPQAAQSQQSIGSLASWGCTPSPGYADGDAHDGFNPNITFPHGQRTPSPMFVSVQYTPYTYSPLAYAASPTPPLRRGALLFSQALSSHFAHPDPTEADMDDIITSCSAAAVASPGFQEQDDTTDLVGEMDAELDYGEEEEEEEEEEPAPTPTSKGKKKRGVRTGERASSGCPKKTSASPKHRRPFA